MELGVEGVSRLADQPSMTPRGRRRRRPNVGRGGPDGASPMTTSMPERDPRPVPPSTLTASMPGARDVLGRQRLLAPTWQMTYVALGPGNSSRWSGDRRQGIRRRRRARARRVLVRLANVDHAAVAVRAIANGSTTRSQGLATRASLPPRSKVVGKSWALTLRSTATGSTTATDRSSSDRLMQRPCPQGDASSIVGGRRCSTRRATAGPSGRRRRRRRRAAPRCRPRSRRSGRPGRQVARRRRAVAPAAPIEGGEDPQRALTRPAVGHDRPVARPARRSPPTKTTGGIRRRSSARRRFGHRLAVDLDSALSGPWPAAPPQARRRRSRSAVTPAGRRGRAEEELRAALGLVVLADLRGHRAEPREAAQEPAVAGSPSARTRAPPAVGRRASSPRW